MKTLKESLDTLRTKQRQAMNTVLREIAEPIDDSEMTKALLEDVAAEKLEQRQLFEQERQNAMQAETRLLFELHDREIEEEQVQEWETAMRAETG